MTIPKSPRAHSGKTELRLFDEQHYYLSLQIALKLPRLFLLIFFIFTRMRVCRLAWVLSARMVGPTLGSILGAIVLKVRSFLKIKEDKHAFTTK